jgi:predicted HTH domain antitoxin
MQLTIQIPDFTPLTLNENIKELTNTIKLNSALMLYKNHKFSIEQASTFANISIYEFMEECNKNQIAVISYDEVELKDELKMMSSL